MSKISAAKFNIGQVIRHRMYPVRGVVFDVDPAFDKNDSSRDLLFIEEWQDRDQPFYYLLAENERTPFVAYFPEQSLMADSSDEPVQHPAVRDLFEQDENGGYRRRSTVN